MLFGPTGNAYFTSFNTRPSFNMTLRHAIARLLRNHNLGSLSIFAPPAFSSRRITRRAGLRARFVSSDNLVS